MTRAEQHLYESRGLLTIPIGRIGKTILPTSLVEFNRMRKKSKMSNLSFDRLGLNQDVSSGEESSDASYSSSSSDGDSLTSLPPEEVDPEQDVAIVSQDTKDDTPPTGKKFYEKPSFLTRRKTPNIFN